MNNMKKIIKLSLLVLLVSNVNATMMPKGNSNVNQGCDLSIGKVMEIHKHERKYSNEVRNQIEEIAVKEVNVGVNQNTIKKGLNKNNKKSLMRFKERKNELDTYSTEIDLKRIREASQRRQKEDKTGLLFWKNIRAKRLAREPKHTSLLEKTIKIHKHEREFSNEVKSKIEDIVKLELDAGLKQEAVRRIFGNINKRRVTRIRKRNWEMATCSTEADLERIQQASKERQVNRERKLEFWQGVRDKEVTKKLKKKNSSSHIKQQGWDDWVWDYMFGDKKEL